MKIYLYTVIIILLNLPFVTGAVESNTEKLRDGYSLQTVQSESVRTRQLFHREKLLGESHSYSIAPSGEYAVFQNVPAGQLFLYRASDDALEQLSKDSPGTVKSYQWNETLEIVRVYFEHKQDALSFAIE